LRFFSFLLDLLIPSNVLSSLITFAIAKATLVLADLVITVRAVLHTMAPAALRIAALAVLAMRAQVGASMTALVVLHTTVLAGLAMMVPVAQPTMVREDRLTQVPVALATQAPVVPAIQARVVTDDNVQRFANKSANYLGCRLTIQSSRTCLVTAKTWQEKPATLFLSLHKSA
jgi:hypothetical protein